MFAEVDVFISNYTLVDSDIYQLWTEGYSCKSTRVRFAVKFSPPDHSLICFSATEAVQFQNTKGVAKTMGAPLELVASDVLDHYRTYSLLERLLHTPAKLIEQPSFQLEPESQQILIEKYRQSVVAEHRVIDLFSLQILQLRRCSRPGNSRQETFVTLSKGPR